MSRLPGYFRDLYLNAHNDVHRLSGTPVDLAYLADASGTDHERVQLDGVVIHCANPKALADAVGHVCASVVPAALDELLRRDDADRDSYFLDPFSLFVLGATGEELAAIVEPFATIVRAALVDHFEEIGEDHGVGLDGLGQALELEVAELVGECVPTLELHAVSFLFEPSSQPRGQRLLDYLFDTRPSCLEPSDWPSRIVL